LSWTTTVFLVLGLTLGLIYLFRILHSAGQVRKSIARMAQRDFRPVILVHPLGLFRKTAENLRSISEYLQRQNQQLADEGFSLRAILSSMVEGVMIVDPAQRIRLVNEALTRMFAMDRSPMNRTVAEVFIQSDLQQAIQKTFQQGEGNLLELTVRGPGTSGDRRFEVYASPLNPGVGSVVRGAVVVFHDITQLKKLEATRREFVANVSHEFRTPLAVISGYIETLMDGALEDQEMAARSLEVMHKHCGRLNLLIEDLLTISRLEHHAMDLNFQSVDLQELFMRTLEQLEPNIRETGGKVRAEFPDGDVKIEADPWRLEQVFFNLLTNALRYGCAVEKPAEVLFHCQRDGAEADLCFSDNGPGIPLEDQPHIFERFYRVHKDRSRIAGGTGLGLSIVKNIVLAHGGTVSVESVPGQGASFRVRLPIRQDAGASSPLSSGQPISHGNSLRG